MKVSGLMVFGALYLNPDWVNLFSLRT